MKAGGKILAILLLLTMGGAVGGVLQANLLLAPTSSAVSGACAGIGWQLCASNKASGSAVTSGAAVIDTRGSDLIIITASHDPSDATGGSITDDQGNGSYTKIDAGSGLHLFYVKPTNVNALHKFNYAGVTTASIISMAFKGSAASSPFETSNSSFSVDGNTTTTGPVTPATDGYLLVIAAKAVLCTPMPTPFTISSPPVFIIPQQAPGIAGVNFGNMGAYYIQPTMLAVDQTVTCTGGNPNAMIASFRSGVILNPNVEVSK